MFAHFDLDAEFLAQFAPQTFLKRLRGLALAAGKLPQTTQVRGGVALGDEQLSFAKYQAGGDFHDDHNAVTGRCSCR